MNSHMSFNLQGLDLAESHVGLSNENQRENQLRNYLFADQSNTSTASTLVNLGNTCFFNSTIQALRFTKPLMEFIGSGYYPDSNHLFNMFSKLLMVMSRKNYQIRPTQFYNAFCMEFKKFDSNHEDAHEVLLFLLDRFDTALQFRPEFNYFDRIWETQDDLIRKSLESMKGVRMSPINNIFMGQTHQEVRCTECGTCSDTFNIFKDIQLSIPQGKGYLNIYHLLRDTCANEQLEGYHCETCCANANDPEKRTVAEKRTMFFRLPKILIAQMVRFDWRGQKNSRFVDFPIWELDMTDYCDYPYRGRMIYDLYAVIYHQGNTFAGHYWTVAKANQYWVVLDDNSHKFVLDEDDVVEGTSKGVNVGPTAYVLFYQKRE